LISVCIITREEAYQYTKYCLQNMLAKTSMQLHVYIYDLTSSSKIYGLFRMFEAQEIAKAEDSRRFTFEFIDDKKSAQEAYNHFICYSDIHSEYQCIVPVSYLLCKDWAELLVHNYEKFEHSGIISIRTGDEKNIGLSSEQSDNPEFREPILESVWAPDSSGVRGLMFFRSGQPWMRECLFYNLTNILGFIDYEVCFHASEAGKKNFYIIGAMAYKHQPAHDMFYYKPTPADIKLFTEYIDARK